ncbi:MAG: hypothetical protein VKJ27_09275 [Synechocystis sp.]|nr:hypothetical protein [Synechocystis sp.]
MRFLLTPDTLEVYFPDGRPFLTTIALAQQAEQARVEAEQAKLALDAEKQRGDRLLAQLKALGVDPETL